VLEVRGLTAIFPAPGAACATISLRLPAGSFTVITGQIGAGKTTLLRALLGLLPHDAGEIRWNGQLVPTRRPGFSRRAAPTRRRRRASSARRCARISCSGCRRLRATWQTRSTPRC
jgi:ABC-type cobalamin/Fe3+-siderophores transport system ATPase subunit